MTPTEIKHWLKDIKHSREWLAQQCGVSKRTVDGWLSDKKASRPIPKSSMLTIMRLMGDDKIHLEPLLSMRTYTALQAVAEAEGKPLNQLIGEIITQYVEQREACPKIRVAEGIDDESSP